jgi:disease resistance protein RPM1
MESSMFTILYLALGFFILLHQCTGAKAAEVAASRKDWDSRFKIIKGICQGLRFLHTLDIPIIHMDLKPENILLDANMVPKIADFALSRVFGQEQTRLCTQTVVGS